MTSAPATPLSAETLVAELHTRWLGKALRLLAEATSTIDVAKQWVEEGAPHGAVVIAERQTQGRGREGRLWASPTGGLWMSMIVHIEAEKAGRLGMGLAVAAAEAVSAEAECEVGLKWPNDLLLDGRKVGGVLGRTEVAFGRVATAVVSLGLNVNFSVADLPPELKDIAATLRDKTGERWSLPRLTADVLARFEEMWPALAGEEGKRVMDGWRRRDMLLGREVSLEVAGKVLSGRAAGIDERGALVIVTDGIEQTVSAGEVFSVSEVPS